MRNGEFIVQLDKMEEHLLKRLEEFNRQANGGVSKISPQYIKDCLDAIKYGLEQIRDIKRLVEDDS